MIIGLLFLVFVLFFWVGYLRAYINQLDRDTTQALKVAGLVITNLTGRVERFDAVDLILTDLARRVERLEAKERGREGL